MQLSQRKGDPEFRKQTLERNLLAVLAGGVAIVAAIIYEKLPGGDPDIAALVLGIVSVVMSAPVLFNGLKALASGRNTTDILASLAVGAAIALHEYPTAGAVSFFLLAGGLLEERTASGAREAIRSLVDLTPARARLKKDSAGETVEVDAAELSPGQVVIVFPGDVIPADGEVQEGRSAVDQSTITGESIPVEVKPGSEVFAGTVNLSGSLEISVIRSGPDTALGRINRLIEEASEGATRLGRFIDVYAGYYTPSLLVVAAAIFYFSGDIYRAIGALIIACPCAFILSSPLASMAGLAAAARMGLMVKKVDGLETAAQIDTVVFDKTGTLTTGKLSVYDLEPVDGVTDEELLLSAGCALSLSNHPVARGIMNAVKENGITLERPKAFKEKPGLGCRATGESFSLAAGRYSYLQSEGVHNLPDEKEWEQQDTGTSILVARDNRYIGRVLLRDTIRADLDTLGSELKLLGIKKSVILTGDREEVARHVAGSLGFDEYRSGLVPEEKVEFVEQLKREGRIVSVVGDGVNDAPALSAGHVGMAVGDSGSGIAIMAADVVFLNDDISKLPQFIALARKTKYVIMENISMAVIFTFGALGFVAAGYISPVAAAIIHNSSTILIALNSSRLVGYSPGHITSGPGNEGLIRKLL